MIRRAIFISVILILAGTWQLSTAEQKEPAPKTTPPRLSVKPVTKPPPTPTPIVVGKNLVVNGTFDIRRPDYNSPLHWDLCCGLTTFYEDCKGRGHISRFDTSVPKEQARERWQVMKKLGVNAPPAPKKAPLGNQYAAIGAVDGIHYYSDPIPVKKGARYKFRVDLMGKNGGTYAKVFIKGYGMVTKKRHIRQSDGSTKEETVTEERQVFKWYLACRGVTGKWQTFEGWIPCKMPQNVDKVRICLFPYWPLGFYYFDNAELFEGKEPPKKKKDEPKPSQTP